MPKWIRQGMMIVLAAVFLTGVGTLVRQALDEYYAERSFAQAAEQAGLAALPEVQTPLAPEPVMPQEFQAELDESVAFLKELDLETLRQTNPEVLGWIVIPGTQLSYPYLQTQDNQYYLYHSWDGQKNAAGSVFLECKVSRDFSDFNTIVYGHNMKNGSIFGSLKQYRKQSHFEQNPSFYIADDTSIRRYDIFAALEAEVVGPTYRLKVSRDEMKQSVLDYSLSHSVIQTGITPTVEYQIVTLSTCTGNGYDTRWVVQGVLVETWPY